MSLDTSKIWDEWWARYNARVDAHRARQAKADQESRIWEIYDALEAGVPVPGLNKVDKAAEQDEIAKWIDTLND